MTAPLLTVKQLRKVFRLGKQEIVAVHDINLSLAPGETLGLVGESGCGKSTLGKTILRLLEPTSGSIHFQGIDICKLSKNEMRAMRRNMQMIFQDPYASLNPRMTVLDIIGEALDIHKIATGHKRKEIVQELIETVGLNPDHTGRFPHEFSGGQRQRIGIARALAVHPSFIVCDEPTSALDVSIQAQIINLLKKLQKELHLSYLFIAHNLAVVTHIADRIAVMYLGNIVELASSEELYHHPQHPYTQALFSAVPIADPILERQRNKVFLQEKEDKKSVKLMNTIEKKGCAFCVRCPHATSICAEKVPIWKEVTPGHFTACHHPVMK